MKKVLVLVLVFAMMMSIMSVGVSAAPPTETGRGAIRFGAIGDSNQFPNHGIHDPTPPGTVPPAAGPGLDGVTPPVAAPGVVWPQFGQNPAQNIEPRQVVDMHNINLHFGIRELPTGAPGTRSWSSLAAGVTVSGTAPAIQPVGSTLPPAAEQEGVPAGTIPAGFGATTHASTSSSNYSRLGLLASTGTTGTGAAPEAPTPLTNSVINVAISHFHEGGTGAPVPSALTRRMVGYELFLITQGTPGYTPSTTDLGTTAWPAPPPLVWNADTTNRPGVAWTTGVRLVQPLPAAASGTFGASAEVIRWRSGFVGIEWAGVLTGNWDGFNILDGEAQVEIRFQKIPMV